MRPALWSSADVAERLKEIGLGKFSEDFKMSDITGIDIYYIPDDELRNVGMTVVQRATYTSWIESLPPNRTKLDLNKRKKLKQYQRIEIKDWVCKRPATESRGNTISKSKITKKQKILKTQLPAQKFICPSSQGEDEFSRIQCVYCGRRFNHDRIRLHEKICAESHSKNRPVFNSQKQRLSGSEAINYYKRAKNVKTKKVNFRAEHQKLVQSLRTTRGVIELNIKDWENYDENEEQERIECPYCSRKFGAECAYKHINSCTVNMNLKKPMHL